MDSVKGPDTDRGDALARLIAQYQTPLLRICYIQLRDRGLAEDAVQETFLKAYRKLDQFRGECSEKTWLTKIAVNTCADLRRGGWFRHVDRRVTPDMLPESAEEPARRDEDLTLAVMNLPYKLRQAITLYYYQDMGVREIAEALGIAQPTVSTRLRRGREKLRRALEGRDCDGRAENARTASPGD